MTIALLNTADVLRGCGQMPKPARPDLDLVGALKSGNEDAFRVLLDRYKDRIFRYLYRMIGDRDWAEDLAQEVFLKVFRKISDFKEESKFSTWLYRIAHNLAIDFLKRKRLEPRLGLGAGRKPAGEAPPEPASPAPEPGETAARKELERNVFRVIESLGPKYKDVFLLCALEGLSYEEAGKALGLSPKTVSSRLCRARKKFLDRISGYIDKREI